jgi:crotonobetainyl-CoA:carnitine CoA-transferase CaiB-like acyl-CoA transferase
MAAWTANNGYEPHRIARSGHPTLVPCQLCRTQDGWIYIMCNKEKFFPALCAKLERPELAKDSRFLTFADRLKNRASLSDLLDEAFVERPTAAWMEVLAGVVPAAPVTNMAGALGAPFTAERGMMVDIKAATGATLSVVGSPFRTGESTGADAAPPLGFHTDELLAEAGYDQSRIDELRRTGVLI